MAGQHPPNPAVGTEGAPELRPYPPTGADEPLEYPHEAADRQPAFHPAPTAGYAGMPGSYPRRRPRRLLIGTLLALALVGALTAAIVYGVRTNGANTGGTFTEASAKTAIQGYLNALQHRDVDVIVRNALCGIYDAVKDRRSDQALAKLSSDAFRKQFSQADVTSIDKVVYWSQYQAQVLFTMQVTPATGGPPKGQVQGIAQLLFQRGQILVCSYVLRTAGHY
ncbi:Rv0361 family membrane protein [Mycobacterium persicum]|uniref:DUF8174 domain-containing protein n=1 Tax=Mycobacterium persicum TaxID=1487726 RepID=A0A1X0L5Z3_9MYCO|nr:hypothetical protein [Mycobacterium persicum]KZS86006.1 hypothetical protein A4G31_02705 [Mycobacterium persicum]ORB36964.1 hypothetical protein BST40_24015 [Mycobacterium persicum]ORB88370.1 hypothetical protein B1T49_02665 [Mycobacterium persicum]ORB93681.1 hypothetical protein B1T44_02995 [Mycobacterium persicum]ORC05783.1 hypothetical protein B4U45_03015 [Mycobacterium persicum]